MKINLNSLVRLIAAIAMSAIVLSGCQAVRSGGAPELSFDVDADLRELSKEFESATNITQYYKNPSQMARDRFITGRLVQIDLRYLIFLRTLTADKQQLDSAVDIANPKTAKDKIVNTQAMGNCVLKQLSMINVPISQ